MEVLEVSGYVSEEKAVIAFRYPRPQAKDASGLSEADIQLESFAVDILIKYYLMSDIFIRHHQLTDSNLYLCTTFKFQ